MALVPTMIPRTGHSYGRVRPTDGNARFSQSENDRFVNAVATVARRRERDSPWRREMADILARYNGDWAIPLPSVENDPTFPALGASIISDTIDGGATRANDTLPMIGTPSVGRSDTASSKALLRKKAWYAHWHKSALPLRLAKAYRHLGGYGTFCIGVRPDNVTGMAVIEIRDPLYAYPEPMAAEEVRTPADIGFVYGRSASFIAAQYPECEALIRSMDPEMVDTWDILHWQDAEYEMVGLLGQRNPDYRMRSSGAPTVNGDITTSQAYLLACAPNKAGACTWICPSGVTLDRPLSNLTRITPMVDLLNKVVALDYVSAEKAIFPDRYVVGREGEAPKIVSGSRWEDGRTGKMNMLQGVQQVGELQSQPGPMTQALMSTLERNARLSSGNPSMLQGEMQPSVRSGQTMNRLAAYSVDPATKEMHTIIEYAMPLVNEAIAKVELGWFASKKFELFSGWASDGEMIEYKPEDIWGDGQTTANVVSYPMPGMDAQNATIALAQMVETGFLSGKTARRKHPAVDDGDMEEQFMLEENLQQAVMSAALGLVQSGAMAFTDLVLVQERVEKGEKLVTAIAEVQKLAQERQAQEAPEPDDPSMLAPPEAMPGLNAPGAGGEAPMPPPPAQGAPPPAEGLDQMVAAMMAGGGAGGAGGAGPMPA